MPSSVPQLTTKQVLTMSFVEGQPITRLRVRSHHTPCGMSFVPSVAAQPCQACRESGRSRWVVSCKTQIAEALKWYLVILQGMDRA